MVLSVVALLSVACGGSGEDTVPRNLTGSFTLTGYGNMLGSTSDSSCLGKGGYEDIREGLGVVVSDEAGKTLATGSLGKSMYTSSPMKCFFPIIVSKTLPKADFYTVEVGKRGDLTYSYDEMVQQDWDVDFTLGK